MRSALVFVLVVATACGPTPALPRSGGTGLFTVTSIVMQKPGELPRACFAMPLPEPPIGCGGPLVGGLNLASLPGYTTSRNGVRATGTVRLVGTWSRDELTVTQRPEPAPERDQTKPPSCEEDGTEGRTTGLPPIMQKVVDDESLLNGKGIQILQMYMCRTALFMVVPVADPATDDFLRNRYGNVTVAGWLLPLLAA